MPGGKRKNPKRIIFLILACLVASALVGCGASVTVYDYSENGQRYNMYELSFDAATVERMESSAAESDGGKKYTVAEYLYELFDDFGYTFVDADISSGYTVRYRKAVSGGGDLAAAGTTLDFVRTSTENPFVRYYTEVSPNPFNGVRKAYDTLEPTRSSTMLERLKNGAVTFNEFGEPRVGQPAITDAFPYLKSVNPDGLPLNYVRYGTSRMTSSGKSIELGNKRAAYVFTRYFDDADAQIVFEYKRAVPYGWYIVALAAGGVVIGVILLATRKKKQKPTLLDRFPYNPEEYRDYESRLPISK